MVESVINEVWKDIEGYEGIYKISNTGKVKSLARSGSGACNKDVILKDFNNGKNYRYISLTSNNKRKNHFIHRLIAYHFIPNPENKPHVNHINGIKGDNRLENLEWATLSENMLHAVKTGLLSAPNSKLNKEIVNEIRQLFKNGLSRKELAIKYKISLANVHRIIHYQLWKVA